MNSDEKAQRSCYIGRRKTGMDGEINEEVDLSPGHHYLSPALLQ